MWHHKIREWKCPLNWMLRNVKQILPTIQCKHNTLYGLKHIQYLNSRNVLGVVLNSQLPLHDLLFTVRLPTIPGMRNIQLLEVLQKHHPPKLIVLLPTHPPSYFTSRAFTPSLQWLQTTEPNDKLSVQIGACWEGECRWKEGLTSRPIVQTPTAICGL